MNYRPTYIEVNLAALKHNIQKLVARYSSYAHHFAVVKADCYGHGAIPCTRAALEAGCDYLCVATLDEALELRAEFAEAPILCLGIISPQFLNVCAENNITVTLSSLDYIRSMPKDLHLRAHIKINTGMNRLGLSTREELNEALTILGNSNIESEGIYTHIYQADDREKTEAQHAKFEEITADCDLGQFKYVHVGASDATEFYGKLPYANACRLGISMYGLIDYPSVKFESTFRLVSEVIQINEVSDGTLGYNGAYKIEGPERIAVIPIGYADGIIRKNSGRSVYINDKPYPIVGNICMDMLFVKVDDTIKVGDKVEVIRDIEHIKEIAKHLDTITYEVTCSVNKRVPRLHI
jgi:alanine racemase